jgi:hypothetical protein
VFARLGVGQRQHAVPIDLADRVPLALVVLADRDELAGHGVSGLCLIHAELQPGRYRDRGRFRTVPSNPDGGEVLHRAVGSLGDRHQLSVQHGPCGDVGEGGEQLTEPGGEARAVPVSIGLCCLDSEGRPGLIGARAVLNGHAVNDTVRGS